MKGKNNNKLRPWLRTMHIVGVPYTEFKQPTSTSP